MRRLPTLAFGALAVATVAAVFITQHLKVTTPLVTGPAGGLPTYGHTPHNIVPTNSRCDSVTLYFQLLHSADSFNLYIVDSRGRVVRTLAADVGGAIKQPFHYSWNGRVQDGAVAPRGLYNFDHVTYRIYRDTTSQTEAFKAGEFDYLRTFSAREWARTIAHGPTVGVGDPAVEDDPLAQGLTRVPAREVCVLRPNRNAPEGRAARVVKPLVGQPDRLVSRRAQPGRSVLGV